MILSAARVVSAIFLLCVVAIAVDAAQPLDTPAPASLHELEQQFANPGVPYRIQFLLRTNDEVDPGGDPLADPIHEGQGLRRRVLLLRAHARTARPQKFMTDWWMKVVDWTAQACADAGLQYWAYDEQDWPSGSVGGQLLEKHPEFRWKYLHEDDTHRSDGPTNARRPSSGDDLRGGRGLPDARRQDPARDADRPERPS